MNTYQKYTETSKRATQRWKEKNMERYREIQRNAQRRRRKRIKAEIERLKAGS